MSTAPRPAASNITRMKPRTAAKPAGTASITPAQRAAVVIAVLGETAAKPIVEKLDDAALAQVAAALETVSFLARDELAEIVIDFLQHLRHNNGAFRGGKARSRQIIESLLDESRLDTVFGSAAAIEVMNAGQGAEGGDVWTRLENRAPEQIAEYFNNLTPNIIALILRKLDVSVASEVVGHLAEDKLDATIGYLVEADRADPEIDGVIGRMVEMEFLNNSGEAGGEEEGSAHLESVGELLSLISSTKRDRLLAFLKTEHEAKAESIEKVMFTIEGLPDMLARNGVPVIFRELGEDTMIPLLSTLTGNLQPVADYLLSNISSRLADQYRDQLNDPDRKPVADPDAVQRGFLTSLMSFKRRGMIVMEKPAA